MIEKIAWDSEFFGRKIGRLLSVPDDDETLKKELDGAVRHKFAYLTCRLPAGEIKTIQRLERHDFYLTDVGIVWARGDAQAPEPLITLREGSVADVAVVRKIAADLFTDGRFYLDPFFTRQEAAGLYQAWAENSLKGHADKVFLVGDKGFITCKIANAVGEISLIGVAASYQGQGIGTALVSAAIQWMQSMEVKSITVRTQAGNMNAIRLYERNSFCMKAADITLAKVFSDR